MYQKPLTIRYFKIPHIIIHYAIPFEKETTEKSKNIFNDNVGTTYKNLYTVATSVFRKKMFSLNICIRKEKILKSMTRALILRDQEI